MMTCPNCRQEIWGSGAACERCGHRFAPGPQAAPDDATRVFAPEQPDTDHEMLETIVAGAPTLEEPVGPPPPAPSPRLASGRPPHMPAAPRRMPARTSSPPRPSAAPVVRIRGGRFYVGTLFGVVAGWILFWLVPTAQATAMLSPVERRGAMVLGWGVVCVALVFLATSLRYRSHRAVTCRRCRTPVVAWRRAFGFECPIGLHYAHVSLFEVVFLALGASFVTTATAIWVIGAV